MVWARVDQQSAKQRIVNSVVLTVVDARWFTAQSLQQRTYPDRISSKYMSMLFAKVVMDIGVKYILAAPDVSKLSFARTRNTNDVGDVSV